MKIEIRHAGEFIDFLRPYEGDLYIYGAGEYGKLIGKSLNAEKIAWKGYVDGCLKTPGTRDEETGKEILVYPAAFEENDRFVLSSEFFAEEMAEQLRNAGVQEDNILHFVHIDDIVWEFSQDTDGWEKCLKKVRQFHNLYQGERCFVIGNGPSLSIADLEKLGNEVTFACNSIYAVYGSTWWRPTYYCAWDAAFCERMMGSRDDVLRLLSGCQAAFTNAADLKLPYRDDKELENLFYVRWKRGVDKETGLSLFSSDPSICCYYSGTVAYMMLQMAVYMGFSKIYLLGIDLSYTSNHKKGSYDYSGNYMEQIKQEEKKQAYISGHALNLTKVTDAQVGCYMSACRYADSHNIKIYNATRGGELEVFERVDLDTLFGC